VKIFFMIVLLIVAFACGGSWSDLKNEQIIKRLEFENHMLKLDIKNLEETLREIRRREDESKS